MRSSAPGWWEGKTNSALAFGHAEAPNSEEGRRDSMTARCSRRDEDTLSAFLCARSEQPHIVVKGVRFATSLHVKNLALSRFLLWINQGASARPSDPFMGGSAHSISLEHSREDSTPFMGSSAWFAPRGLRSLLTHSVRAGRALSACFLAQAGLTLTLPLSYAFAHLAVSAIALTPFPFGSCLHFLPALLSSRLLVSG